MAVVGRFRPFGVPCRRLVGRQLVAIAASLVEAYPRRMCRNVTRDQRIEGWRATVELLAVFRPSRVGVMAAALMAYLHRNIFAAGARRV